MSKQSKSHLAKCVKNYLILKSQNKSSKISLGETTDEILFSRRHISHCAANDNSNSEKYIRILHFWLSLMEH